MICPLCATRVPVEAETCPNCGTGLVEFATVAYLPAWLHNKALTALRRDQWGEAATLFAQAALLAPNDVDLLRGWAHALVQSGHAEEALETISQALDQGGPEVQEQYEEILALFAEPEPSVEPVETTAPVPVEPEPSVEPVETTAPDPPTDAPASDQMTTTVRRRIVFWRIRFKNRGTDRHLGQEDSSDEPEAREAL